MNFNHLYIFHRVAEKQHFTLAAQELFISQPAVSKQIHELERSLGQALFVQIGRKMYLTEAGKILYDYTCRIFALATEAEEALDEMQNLERGHLKIGASTTIGVYLLPELLGYYRRNYPHIDLSLTIANANEIQEMLSRQRVEVGLIEGSVTHPELDKQVWQQDELVLIVSLQDPILATADPTLHYLLDNNYPILLREQGSGTREIFEKAIGRLGLQPVQPFMELGSTEAIKRAVVAGLGVAFVSKHTIQLELLAGQLEQVPLVDFQLVRPLYITYPKHRRFSKALRMFLDMIESPARD